MPKIITGTRQEAADQLLKLLNFDSVLPYDRVKFNSRDEEFMSSFRMDTLREEATIDKYKEAIQLDIGRQFIVDFKQPITQAEEEFKTYYHRGGYTQGDLTSGIAIGIWQEISLKSFGVDLFEEDRLPQKQQDIKHLKPYLSFAYRDDNGNLSGFSLYPTANFPQKWLIGIDRNPKNMDSTNEMLPTHQDFTFLIGDDLLLIPNNQYEIEGSLKAKLKEALGSEKTYELISDLINDNNEVDFDKVPELENRILQPYNLDNRDIKKEYLDQILEILKQDSAQQELLTDIEYLMDNDVNFFQSGGALENRLADIVTAAYNTTSSKPDLRAKLALAFDQLMYFIQNEKNIESRKLQNAKKGRIEKFPAAMRKLTLEKLEEFVSDPIIPSPAPEKSGINTPVLSAEQNKIKLELEKKQYVNFKSLLLEQQNSQPGFFRRNPLSLTVGGLSSSALLIATGLMVAAIIPPLGAIIAFAIGGLGLVNSITKIIRNEKKFRSEKKALEDKISTLDNKISDLEEKISGLDQLTDMSNQNQTAPEPGVTHSRLNSTAAAIEKLGGRPRADSAPTPPTFQEEAEQSRPRSASLPSHPTSPKKDNAQPSNDENPTSLTPNPKL